MVSCLVKTIYTGDFWRQFLTIITGVPHHISGRSDKKCELTPQSYVPNVTQLRPMALPFKSIALFDGEPAINSIFSTLQLHCTAVHVKTQDFKMTKSMMLSVVALAFLSLGSSKHMKFKDCGKLAFQLRFLTIFVPVQGHRDHVTSLSKCRARAVKESRRVEFIVILLYVAKVQKNAKTEKRFQVYDNHCFFS